MNDSRPVLLEKNVVLIGAGNAHLQFVKMFGMHPMPGVAVTLVSETPVIPYSAMVPGHIAGDYRWDEITIDLVRLCRSAGVRFLPQRACRIDTAGRAVHFADRPPLAYDVLSLGLGSLSACPTGSCDTPTSWILRPLTRLVGHLEALDRELRDQPRSFHLVIVGGGASGCELALAIRKRFADLPQLRLTLLQGDDRLFPRFPAKTATIFAALFAQRDITVRVGARVTGGDQRTLEINGGERLAYDTVLWATNAAPPPLLKGADLPLSDGGFLRVRETLQSVADPAVFGTGDCISLDAYPDLLKNGVYAVRQGKVLFDNVSRFLHEQPLVPFRPQRRCLCLLNTADGQAALCYGPLVWKGNWPRRLKDAIDREWIEKFTVFPAMAETDAQPLMRCGGCGSKIGGDVLSSVLGRLDVGHDSRILLGSAAKEDAAVHRMRGELFSDAPDRLVEVQTVDYFKAFIDDPYLFGRIAALNAVSDLYAMNARPFSALAIATLPYARGPVQQAMLHELLTGAVESLRGLGVVLTGGHTTEGSELALGFAVTGYAEDDTLFQKGNLRPGDALILTKPIGSGALLAAWMRGRCRAEWYEALMRHMLQANAAAAEVFRRHGVRACTDVTGFGLAGHLLEMLDASAASARLDPARVPLYEGFADVVGEGIVSTLHEDNAKYGCRVEGDQPWLFDPQTSGGLVAGVDAARVDAVLHELHEAGYAHAARIGVVTAPGESASIRVDLGSVADRGS